MSWAPELTRRSPGAKLGVGAGWGPQGHPNPPGSPLPLSSRLSNFRSSRPRGVLGVFPAEGNRTRGESFLGRGQRGRGTGARRFRRPPARTGKAAGAALRMGPRGGRDRKEGSVPEPRGAKRGRPADPSGAESSHPELPECRRGEPKLPTGTRRINVAARPPPGRDGSLYRGNSWKETWSGL